MYDIFNALIHSKDYYLAINNPFLLDLMKDNINKFKYFTNISLDMHVCHYIWKNVLKSLE